MPYIQPPRIIPATRWRPAHRYQPNKVGWYPCSLYMDHKILRYWDGSNWSIGVHMCVSSRGIENKIHARGGSLPIDFSVNRLSWTSPWWEAQK